MKRLARLEKNGWNVVMYYSGNGCRASKGIRKVYADSITALHRKIFGYA